jgi:putative ABC transport system permease protein
MIALGIAVSMTYLLLPLSENLTGKVVEGLLAIEFNLWLNIVFGTLLIGLLAGTYPAFVLSGFRPVMVLKGQLKSGKSGTVIRSVLVVFQFAMSVILIVGTVVVYKQLQFVQDQNLGFDREGVLILDNTYTLGDQLQAFKETLLTNPKVENVTISGYLPTANWRSDSPFQAKEKTDASDAVGLQVWGADYDYIKTMRMKILAGRDFSEELVSDSSAVIINQTAAKRFGFENPVGRKIKTLGEFKYNNQSNFTIIGIVEDFHYDSMRDNIGPLMFLLQKNTSVIAIRYSTSNLKEFIGEIEGVWNDFNPNHPLDYDFMDRQFDAKYDAEMKLGSIFTVFGVFAIIIASLGLFGLSAFTAEQRRKEIGIRKVLGASISSLVGLLFSGYTRLLLISLVIGLPVAFILMNKWLEDFAYHTEIGAGVLLVSALLALVVAWLTVSYQSMKAARLNPAENLRTE